MEVTIFGNRTVLHIVSGFLQEIDASAVISLDKRKNGATSDFLYICWMKVIVLILLSKTQQPFIYGFFMLVIIQKKGSDQKLC